MNFEEAYFYFVVKQNLKLHSSAPADPCKLGVLEFEWEHFFIPKEYIITIQDKECWYELGTWIHRPTILEKQEVTTFTQIPYLNPPLSYCPLQDISNICTSSWAPLWIFLHSFCFKQLLQTSFYKSVQ